MPSKSYNGTSHHLLKTIPANGEIRRRYVRSYEDLRFGTDPADTFSFQHQNTYTGDERPEDVKQIVRGVLALKKKQGIAVQQVSGSIEEIDPKSKILTIKIGDENHKVNSDSFRFVDMTTHEFVELSALKTGDVVYLNAQAVPAEQGQIPK